MTCIYLCLVLIFLVSGCFGEDQGGKGKDYGRYLNSISIRSITESPTNPTAPRIPVGACSGAAVAVETRPADCYVILLMESQLLRGLTLLVHMLGYVLQGRSLVFANVTTSSEDSFKGVKLSKESMQTSFASDTTNKGSFTLVSYGKASSDFR